MNLYEPMILAAGNPFVEKINGMLGEAKGWLLALIVGITVLVVIWHGIQYQQGGSDEKAKALKDIKKDIFMGGGIFFLVWLATYVIEKMQ